MTIEVSDPLIFGLLEDPGNMAGNLYLHSFRYRNNLLMGRGGGKTVRLCVKDALFHSLYPGTTTYITEQTGPDVIDTLLSLYSGTTLVEGRYAIPKSLYRVTRMSSGKFDIEWSDFGGVTKCRSRKTKTSTDEPPFRGPSAQAIFHDEAALDKFQLEKTLTVSEGMLRGGDRLMLDCVSTPKVGGLHAYMTRLGLAGDGAAQYSRDAAGMACAAFYGPTTSNAYNDDLDSRLRATMSPQEAEQELEARWVSLSGRIWENWSDKLYPTGNIYPDYEYDGGAFFLAADIGVKGAYGLFQRVPATGQNTPVVCLVAEWQTSDGNVRNMVREIDEKYGRPAFAITGADVNTRSVGSGRKPAFFFAEVWPGMQIRSVSGLHGDKELQHWTMQSAILNGYGQRQLVVAEKCHHHTPQSGRTIHDLMRLDSWPEGQAPGAGFFAKDKATSSKPLEDERDMLLYASIKTWPPQARQARRIA
ncbi:MAG: hypothetical protein GY832_23795 [Chloroflexi bacterium]|nr:hypothetical protein [Chloroflexota bacterium]